MRTRGKVTVVVCISIVLLMALIGGILGSLWEPEMTLFLLLEKIEAWMQGQVTLRLQKETGKGAVGMGLLGFLLVLVYLTGKRKYLFGKEYGTATLMDAKAADLKLRNEKESENRFLSQHLALSLDAKKTRLNNNVLVVGGSGAGKTLFFVTVNLLLCEGCSFIVTDPKGENIKNCAGILKEKGYVIKVLNLVEMEKSDGYNPFRYIRNENDIIKLVTNLISNTTPSESKSTDPFWESATCL